MVVRASITAFTHPGLVRDQNQDAVGVGNWLGEGTLWRPWRTQTVVVRPLLCVIADGMGGHAAGEVASTTAVRHLMGAEPRMTTAGDVARAINEADAAIHAQADADPALAGMGTTVVGLLLTPARLIWFNVGDSRLYQFREGYLRQVSVDDVPASGSQTDSGPRESHLLSASLGGSRRMRPDPHIGTEEPPLPASRWLMCSDGLTDMLSRRELEAAMARDDLEAWLALFAGAMEAGAEDNLSILLITVETTAAEDSRYGA